ncbi:hypothetical protein [Amycolatopsis sp.]
MLPLIFYGGSSSLVTMAVFGLLANFARNEPRAAAPYVPRSRRLPQVP